MTVVVETHGTRTYVGRYDREDDHGVHLLDVGVHEASADIPKEEYLRRSAKFGVRTDHKHVIVPPLEVARITRLGELG
jgi:hypothetical protein